MRKRWLLVSLLAGCAKVLDFSPIPVPVAGGPTTMAAGSAHTCVIRANSTLWCWGENDDGQLGVGLDTLEIDAPVQISTDEWKQVSSGVSSTCAIRSDDTLWCWGDNGEGQLGFPPSNNSTTPVQVPGTWRAVATGDSHTCAITSDGALQCWGDNGNGELGDGTRTRRSTPQEVAGGGHWQSVSIGEYHTCAIDSDGAAWCWGYNSQGQLGTGAAGEAMLMPAAIADTDHYAVVSAGYEHSCGMTVDGHLRCWGNGIRGELGVVADQRDAPGPVTIDNRDDGGFAGIATNGRHACAWKPDGTAYCWGQSSRGELGSDGDIAVTEPVVIPGTWRGAAVGLHHVCWADDQAGFSCIGSRGWGQLGNGPSAQLQPQKVDSNAYLRVYAGEQMTCAIGVDPMAANNGPGACGGDNSWGALGQGDRRSRQTLAPVLAGTRLSTFALGSEHACAIDKANNTYCAGHNNRGQLGIAQSTQFLTQPMLVSVADPAKSIAAYFQTCEVGAASTLRCWGADDLGQAGDGKTSDVTDSATAVAIDPAGEVWQHVAAGDGFTCGLKSTSGALWCWGQNSYGQLGRMTPGNMPAGPAPSGLTNANKLFASSDTACAIISGGNAKCWGVWAGQHQTTPVDVAPGMQWAQFAVGYRHLCGITDDTATAPNGRLFCWGSNNRGQLGTGTMTDAAQPAQIPGLWLDVAAGWYHTCAVDSTGALYCWGSDEDGALLDGNAWTAELVPVDLPAL